MKPKVHALAKFLFGCAAALAFYIVCVIVAPPDVHVDTVFGAILLVSIVAAFYFAPAIGAFMRQHDAAGVILLVNLLFGWTVIGWLLCAAWATTQDNSPTGLQQKALRNRQMREYEACQP